MSFLYDIFNQLKTAEKTTVLRELNDQESPQQVRSGVTGKEPLMQDSQARRSLAGRGLGKGARWALLARNSIDWVASALDRKAAAGRIASSITFLFVLPARGSCC